MARFLPQVRTYLGPDSKLEEPAMQKKSLFKTLKTMKKANVAVAPAKKEESVTKKINVRLARMGRNPD